MYQVLARKYRPQKFSELIGQEHVRTTLQNAISQQRIAHGYIFSGQRGTGKTTVARLLALCLNCAEGPSVEPCGQCSSCREIAAGNSVDVIEIDAASNRGINEMRELRESVKYHPSRDRYKVFIIDEAHQITSEAFNALLKTLEEPPEWVVFVLCTTEAHKIPSTIVSRCQQFSFRSVDPTEVVARLKWICEQEGIETDEESLVVLADAGGGSVRDSLSALDQVIACCGSKLNVPDIRRLLGMFSLDSLHQVTEALASGDSARMIEIVHELESNGHNLQHFCRELARYFRNLLVAKVAGPGARLIPAPEAERKRMAEIAETFSEEDLTRYLQITLDLFRNLQTSVQPRLHLEIGLLKLVHAGRLTPIEEALAALEQGGSGGDTPPPNPGGSRGPVRRTRVAGARQTTPATRNLKSPKAAAATVPEPPVKQGPTAQEPPSPPNELPPPPTEEEPAPDASSFSGWKGKLYREAMEQGMTFVADAVEHAEITESEGTLRFVAAKEFGLALRSGELKEIVHKIAGKPMKVTFTVGEVSSVTAETVQTPARTEGEVEKRALEHAEVKRFQELFPGSQVRVIRNLKQSGRGG